jgi:hypothetical protein
MLSQMVMAGGNVRNKGAQLITPLDGGNRAGCLTSGPNAPFAELVRLSKTDIAEEMREEHRRQVMGE